MQKGSLFMIRRYQECDGGSKHEHLSTLPRTRSPDSTSDETSDAFAGGKWPEIGRFVRAEVSSVSGEVVGGCCETAVVPVSAKKLAQQEWILGHTAKKFALQAKKR